jgi:DNA repair exonuclease SbcCD ATPase subunit
MKSSSIKPTNNSKESLENTLREWKEMVNNHQSEYQKFISQREQEKIALRSLESEIAALEGAQQLVQAAAQEIQNRVHTKIASVVTRCLSGVFGPDAYEFKILFQKKRGKTEAQLLFFRDGHGVDPLTEAGGGVVDIASFALRLAAILASVPKLRRFVVVDEPFRHLNLELRPVALQLLKELATELDIQFLVVTHMSEIEDLDVGRIIRL